MSSIFSHGPLNRSGRRRRRQPYTAGSLKRIRILRMLRVGPRSYSSKSKHPTTGERRGVSNGSWFGNAIESINQLIGSRK